MHGRKVQVDGARLCSTWDVHYFVCLQCDLDRGIDIQDRQLQLHARLCDVR